MAAQISPGSGQSKPHAGVTLDVSAIDHAALHDPASTHVEVEPIPWKTGDVGAVKPIDRETPLAAPPRRSAPPAPAAPKGEGS
ncbi:MAG TPA: hypothetical protein VLT33_09130 [Labilithrix sp.]|nr:hypothetical protein [Labilithrix sp.]